MKHRFGALFAGVLIVVGAGIAGNALGDGPPNWEPRRPATYRTPQRDTGDPITFQGAHVDPVAGTDALDDCPTVEDNLARIALVTDDASIQEIVVALQAVEASPLAAQEDEGPLAQRLREALNLSSVPPCATARQAFDEALRLAQLSQHTVETAALGPQDPPSRFSDERSGIATGASVSGYN